MTTDPGDLVLDPTCGSGTTAFVAEQWGRRWITIDVSRVPLAITRQRLLSTSYDWYALKDPERGPASGFQYKRRQNGKGEEVGGVVPHVTLKSIANDEPPEEEVLVDRPEVDKRILRVTGPFRVEASIPKPADDAPDDTPSASFAARVMDALRRSPNLHFDGNQTVTVRNVRPPAKSLHLSAEGELVNGHAAPVAFLIGPENGPITDRHVTNALKEASRSKKEYVRLLVIGLSIQPAARITIESAADIGLPANYLQVTPDLLMGDLLKNMRSSQVFSVCGLPEVAVRRYMSGANGKKASGKNGGGKNGNGGKPTDPIRYQVELLGLDVFDPITMENTHRAGTDVPAWFLDVDYNGSCFIAGQAFFPRTAAWDNLKRELRGTFQDDVWEHLAGAVSAPFEAGEHRQIAVKVIDDRGNELMVVKSLDGV